MITEVGFTRIATSLQDAMKEGRYFIDNIEYTVPILKTLRHENEITFYLYLGEGIEGKLTKFQLIDVGGDVFADQPVEIEKVKRQSLTISFTYTLSKPE